MKELSGGSSSCSSLKAYHRLPGPALRQAGLSSLRAAGSPTLPDTCTHSERKYARLLLTHHRLSVCLAEERMCVLTLVEGRCEDIEVWQRDGSFLGMKEAGLVNC